MNGINSLQVRNNLQQNGIEIITATDSNFDGELRKFIGGRKDFDPLIEEISPLMFFIRNNSSKEIVGVSLSWEITKTDGKTFTSIMNGSSPGMLMGLKPHDPSMIGKLGLINKNSLKFYSYFSSVDQIIENANKSAEYGQVKFEMKAEYFQQILHIINLQKGTMKDFSNISASIDGLCFSDGTFVGDDKNFFFDYMRGFVQARRDLVKTMRESKTAGKSDSQIIDSLIADIQPDRLLYNGRPSNKEEAFEQAYKLHLNMLKQELQNRREKSTDEFLIKDYLAVQDADFIAIHKLNR